MIVKADEDRQTAYRQTAGLHIRMLRIKLERMERQDPDYFMSDPEWFRTYVLYSHATFLLDLLEGDQDNG